MAELASLLGVPLLLALCSWLVTLLLTRAYCRWALSRAVLDHPGPRSSHVAATPTGGGIGLVGGVCAAVAVLVLYRPAATPLLLWILLAAALALVGMIDDRRALPVSWRLAAQLACSALALFGFAAWSPPLVSLLAAVLCLVWLTNLFNFMDGIDGIAASQALCVALAAALLLPPDSAYRLLLIAVAAACCGFLQFNWPPARLFMGDTGSLFLGFLLGTIGLATVFGGELGAWTWLILWACFIADASLTLVLRGLRREPLHQAHREHAYQRLARYRAAHRPVTVALLAVNLCWLWPLALLAEHASALAPLACLLAYAPLLALVLWLERRESAAQEAGKMPE